MLLSCVLMSCIASAQEEKVNEEPQRKKVGVVLSGGGAKGMAHIRYGAYRCTEGAGEGGHPR